MNAHVIEYIMYNVRENIRMLLNGDYKCGVYHFNNGSLDYMLECERVIMEKYEEGM